MPDSGGPRAAYNSGMHANPSSSPPFAVGGLFLEALAAHRFDQLAEAVEPDATLLALLPRGFVDWHGAAEVCAAFRRWFGDVDAFEVADASVGQVGALLQLRWRLRLQGPRLGEATKVVEQHVYAATGSSGRISKLSLLCSGFWDERADGGGPPASATRAADDDEE
jgi:hypothetical protein